jgi:membrane associated rhomboid family serine protease
MIPLRDNLPTRRLPIVTLLLIGVNGYIFLRAFLLGPWAGQRFISYYGLIPCGLTGHCVIVGRAFSPEVTLFTSMFVHAGLFHLAGNMLYLWIFGNNVEDAIGKVRFLIFYLLCGVGSAWIQILVNPASRIPMVGASGAISGVLGAYLVLFPHARILTLVPLGLLFPILEIRAVFVIGFWVIVQVLNGLLTFSYEGGGVAWFAHIGGFAVGLALVPFVRRGSLWRGWRRL